MRHRSAEAKSARSCLQAAPTDPSSPHTVTQTHSARTASPDGEGHFAAAHCRAQIGDVLIGHGKRMGPLARCRGPGLLGKFLCPTLFALLCLTPYVYCIKCFVGSVTYCGINADGGALPAAGGRYYVQGMNWACQDQQSNMDPTFIAPNCWDQESCEALQTDEFDDPFAVAHEPPYNYVADVGYITEQMTLPSERRRAELEQEELTQPAHSSSPTSSLDSSATQPERRNGAATADNSTNTTNSSSTTTTAAAGNAAATTAPAATPAPVSPQRSCPADHPACGLQTTMRRGEEECSECYTRFRYSADMGAIYWNIWQIEKKCVAAGATCADSSCNCTREAPFYKGECSVWAQSACRRKAFKCEHFPADYVVTTFQDYDIKFCSLGPDDPHCSGCVACTDPSCLQPVIHEARHPLVLGITDPAAQRAVFRNASSYNCSLERCGEAPRTCWNRTCAYTDDCWPECDAAIYQSRIPAALMGFYVTKQDGVMVEQVKCCDSMNYCNYPNPAPAARPPVAGALLLAFISLVAATL